MMSFFKSFLLKGVDLVNGAPKPFNRPMLPDPSIPFLNEDSHLRNIMAAAEHEIEGFVKDGAFVAQKPNDLGDAAIWQGVYTAMAAMRWHVQPSPKTQTALVLASTALSRYINRGVLCRGAMPRDLEGILFHRDPSKTYYDDDGFVFREDASLDSLVGVMFGAAIANRFGGPEVAAILAGPLKELSSSFTKAGFKLISRDGKPTTHGNCTPGVIQAPVRIIAAALPSLVSGGEEWKGIAGRFAPEFAVPDTQIPGKMSWVNAHLAILSTLTFVAAAPEGAPGLKEAKRGLASLLSKYTDAGNSFLVFAAAVLGASVSSEQLDKATKALLEFPVGAKPAAVIGPDAPADQPVPAWKRPPADVFWQRNPYTQKGSESNEYTRLDFLLALYLKDAVGRS